MAFYVIHLFIAILRATPIYLSQNALLRHTLLVTAVFLCILHLNGAKKVNAVVTLHRKDMFSLFTEGEIWGIQFKNKTEDIVEIEVVIDEYKSMNLTMVKSFDIIYSDVDQVIRRERSRINNTTKWTCSMQPNLFFEEFRDWPQYIVFIDALLLRFPFITSRSYIGETIEGRSIPVITLSTGNNKDKPGFYIQAQLHAREWLANSATMYILNALAEGYKTDNRITNILDSINIYIVPTVNIDGYIYTWQHERMWRKNRRNNNDGTFGVDLNRNYGAPTDTWCTSGASTNTNSDIYCGSSPYSEPEAKASAQFVINPLYNIHAVFDMHTFGELILWPWAYTHEPLSPKYYEEFYKLGAELQTAVAHVNGVEYESIQSSDLYPCSGSMVDFAFAQSNGEITSFTFEGRGPGFNPSPTNIIPAGEEQLAAVLKVAETLI